MDAENTPRTPPAQPRTIFLDLTGRRRWIVMAGGYALATALVTYLCVLALGVVSPGPYAFPGWPEYHRPATGTASPGSSIGSPVGSTSPTLTPASTPSPGPTTAAVPVTTTATTTPTGTARGKASATRSSTTEGSTGTSTTRGSGAGGRPDSVGPVAARNKPQQ
ncbi:MAG: hypothetical protein GXX79_21175 [Actinomycetales bacterium]|nr:hypothetical protein [Actinomycetales bacterium]